MPCHPLTGDSRIQQWSPELNDFHRLCENLEDLETTWSIRCPVARGKLGVYSATIESADLAPRSPKPAGRNTETPVVLHFPPPATAPESLEKAREVVARSGIALSFGNAFAMVGQDQRNDDLRLVASG